VASVGNVWQVCVCVCVCGKVCVTGCAPMQVCVWWAVCSKGGCRWKVWRGGGVCVVAVVWCAWCGVVVRCVCVCGVCVWWWGVCGGAVQCVVWWRVVCGAVWGQWVPMNCLQCAGSMVKVAR